MVFGLVKRMLTEVDKRLLWKFCYNMGFKGAIGIAKFKKRLKRGELFPAFMMISVTNQCNFNCQGCWVNIDNSTSGMSFETLDNIILSAKAKGSYFFGILGGEPLMYKHLFEIFEKHPDCYFQLFTNGTLLTDEVAKRIRKLGNISPLVSVEGLENVSDIRRGAQKVYSRTQNGIEACVNNKIITGVAASICQSNFDELVSEKYLDDCIKKGIQYVWYYIFRPVGAEPSRELVLSEEQILKLRKFMVDMRTKKSIVIIDTYWDQNGKALCPAVDGLSHHINAEGDLEFCPPIQFACENVGDAKDMDKVIENSDFIRTLRTEIPKHTGGCILLDNPGKLTEFAKAHNAYDSSGRNSAFAEVSAMCPCAGHHIEGKEIPEKNLFYRIAKKNMFFGLGAYG